MNDESSSGASGSTTTADRSRWALSAIAGLAALLLVVGLGVWLAGRNDDSSVSTSTTPTTGVTVPVTSTTIESTTTAAPTTTTTSTTSTSPPTTAAPTTAAPTTIPVAAFALPAPGATSWTVPIMFVPGLEELTLELAATQAGLAAYDGTDESMRCIAVVVGDEDYRGWCGAADAATRFVIDDGFTPWLVEVGDEQGSIALLEQESGWTLPSNGCDAPIATILAAADPGPLAVTGIRCADDEAFVSFGTLLFGSERFAPDGGGILVGRGDEGWDVVLGFGTSFDCDDRFDGVDRCTSFDVGFDLFEAVLPVPSPDVTARTVDVTGVLDRTAEIEGWIGDELDPAVIDSIIVDRLFDPDAEIPAVVRRASRLGYGNVDLLVVQIPQMDDSIATETWAVWIGVLEETAGVRAFSWNTCARGVTGDGLCV